MVYAVACPLSHGFCALGELGEVSPTLNSLVCVYVKLLISQQQ